MGSTIFPMHNIMLKLLGKLTIGFDKRRKREKPAKPCVDCSNNFPSLRTDLPEHRLPPRQIAISSYNFLYTSVH